jgi:hypothetical protein
MKIDLSEVEVGMARYVADNIFAQQEALSSCVVVVSGPDEEGDICILAGAETYLPREVAFRLANEILLRLKASAPQ